ncbi:HDOD domain-containing protein [Rubrivivax gelatinosus]|uniref:HDOD domain-containing protein n=1 Tax=Rubrivivax gelatinosus TaxID=28068 RepID=UPI0005C20B4B|nr:HDOD domain-containing protein [Rubrivivax gelatinosus]MBG6083216.1 HD-like signal output (HDOD) protein [Rubrivivax gelatinosus]
MTSIARVFSQAARLPHMPEVAVELERLTRVDHISSRQLAAAVARDPTVAAKVLRLANSALYFRQGEVASIEDAIRIVGVSDFRTLVLASCVVSAFPLVPLVDLRAHWSHAVAAGAIAQAACRPDSGQRSAAFTAGLLHTVGVLLMHVTLPKPSARVEQRAQGQDPVARVALEREVFGFDHAAVGAELLRRWKLPQSVCDAVRLYPDVDAHSDALPVAVHLGSRLAPTVGSPLSADLSAKGIDLRLMQRLSLTEEWLGEDLPDAMASVEEVVTTLNEA